MLFSELAKMYLADKKDGRKAVRANTLEGYQSAITNHLLPKWGQAEVETISFEDVQSWVDSFPEGSEAAQARNGDAIRTDEHRVGGVAYLTA